MTLTAKIICFTSGLVLVTVMRGALAPTIKIAPPLPVLLRSPRLLAEPLAGHMDNLPAHQVKAGAIPAAAVLASNGESDRRLVLDHLQLTK